MGDDHTNQNNNAPITIFLKDTINNTYIDMMNVQYYVSDVIYAHSTMEITACKSISTEIHSNIKLRCRHCR